MNLTPRAKFQANVAQARAHLDLVTNDGFRNACEAALIEQILNMPNVDDQIEAAAAYHRIKGATDFLQRLLSIAETSPPPQNKPRQNLDFTH